MATRSERVATALSGGISGGLVSIAVQPLDVIRTRMQGDGAKGFVRGTLPTIRRVYKESGLLGFWRGTTPTFVRMTIGAGLHFMCLEMIKSFLQSKDQQKSHLLRDASIGGMARGAVTIALCPITVIKTRMEYVDRPYRSIVHAGVTIARTEGMAGLFRGVVPTFVSNAPFSALHYMFYRKMQTTMYADADKPSMTGNFICSTVAAAAATLITQPADVVRTRIQLGLGASGALSSVLTLRDAFVAQGLHGITLGALQSVNKMALWRFRGGAQDGETNVADWNDLDDL